jgi:hypothetical protein
MINAQMKTYDYFRLLEPDAYGQRQLPPEDAVPEGQVKMAINISSQSIQDNINYQDCNYIGLTHSSLLDDSCVVQYGKERLKVLYINPIGRLKQVFLKLI